MIHQFLFIVNRFPFYIKQSSILSKKKASKITKKLKIRLRKKEIGIMSMSIE